MANFTSRDEPMNVKFSSMIFGYQLLQLYFGTSYASCGIHNNRPHSKQYKNYVHESSAGVLQSFSVVSSRSVSRARRLFETHDERLREYIGKVYTCICI